MAALTSVVYNTFLSPFNPWDKNLNSNSSTCDILKEGKYETYSSVDDPKGWIANANRNRSIESFTRFTNILFGLGVLLKPQTLTGTSSQFASFTASKLPSVVTESAVAQGFAGTGATSLLFAIPGLFLAPQKTSVALGILGIRRAGMDVVKGLSLLKTDGLSALNVLRTREGVVGATVSVTAFALGCLALKLASRDPKAAQQDSGRFDLDKKLISGPAVSLRGEIRTQAKKDIGDDPTVAQKTVKTVASWINSGLKKIRA